MCFIIIGWRWLIAITVVFCFLRLLCWWFIVSLIFLFLVFIRAFVVIIIILANENKKWMLEENAKPFRAVSLWPFTVVFFTLENTKFLQPVWGGKKSVEIMWGKEAMFHWCMECSRAWERKQISFDESECCGRSREGASLLNCMKSFREQTSHQQTSQCSQEHNRAALDAADVHSCFLTCPPQNATQLLKIIRKNWSLWFGSWCPPAPKQPRLQELMRWQCQCGHCTSVQSAKAWEKKSTPSVIGATAGISRVPCTGTEPGCSVGGYFYLLCSLNGSDSVNLVTSVF